MQLNSSFILAIILLLGSCKNTSSNVLDNTNSKLNGKWLVVKSSFVPFEHISYCEKLEIGSIFNFEDNGKLIVFNNGEKINCNQEQFFELDSNKVRIQEWDMFFTYEIEKLNSDTLVFIIKRIPSYIFEDSIDIAITSEIKIDDPNFYTRIKREGIKIELLKKDDD